jgi:hypothetical protein
MEIGLERVPSRVVPEGEAGLGGTAAKEFGTELFSPRANIRVCTHMLASAAAPTTHQET